MPDIFPIIESQMLGMIQSQSLLRTSPSDTFTIIGDLYISIDNRMSSIMTSTASDSRWPRTECRQRVLNALKRGNAGACTDITSEV